MLLIQHVALVGLSNQLVVMLPAAWLLSKTGEVINVWWAFLIAELACLTLSTLFMIYTNKKVIAPMYGKTA